MKKFVLSAALLLGGALGAYAQTKGTNSLGLGIETSKNKFNSEASSTSNSLSKFSLRYANFVKDNVKLGTEVFYNREETASGKKNDGYGASFLYQKYYPVYKKLNVFIGGEAVYSHFKSSNFDYYANGYPAESTTKFNSYTLGAYGGASYFLGKHWELEARILNASFGYVEGKNELQDSNSSYHNFSLKTTGAFTNLGFSINFLF